MRSSGTASASTTSDLADPNTLDDNELREHVTGLLIKDRIQLLLRKPSSQKVVSALVHCLPRDALVDYVNCCRNKQFAYDVDATYSLSEDLDGVGQQVYMHLFRLTVVDARTLANRVIKNSKTDKEFFLFDSKYCKLWANKVLATIRNDSLSDSHVLSFRYVGAILSLIKTAH